jgi:hypothetical protein
MRFTRTKLLAGTLNLSLSAKVKCYKERGVEEDSGYEVKVLLEGAIPERQEEMNEYWDKYIPYFSRVDDRPGYFMEAGPFQILRFTQRTMHQMWMLGFAATQAFNTYSQSFARLRLHSGKLDTNELCKSPAQVEQEEKYRDLVRSVLELSQLEDPTSFSWPKTVPNPRNRKPSGIEDAATYDLICMAGAYVFLHEIKHILFLKDNNSPSNRHDEELEFDLFAQSMIFDKLHDYAKQNGYDLLGLKWLKSKRAMSISLALFFMLVITPKKNWGGTDTHPNIAERIASLLGRLSIHYDDTFWIYTASLFLAHIRYLDATPLLIEFKTIKDLAIELIAKVDNSI